MRILLLAISVFLCSACLAREPSVVLKGERFTVELAETREKQTLGLMFRDSLPEDHGMLFVFPAESLRSFYMKNTRIPLDIIYFDEDMRLVSVAENARPCRTRVRATCSNFIWIEPVAHGRLCHGELAGQRQTRPVGDQRLGSVQGIEGFVGDGHKGFHGAPGVRFMGVNEGQYASANCPRPVRIVAI
jgi:uncharacterized membrane protein (UPF0127 family)